MTARRETMRQAAISGTLAGLFSAAAMAAMGKLERNNAVGPLNGPSQWLWGEPGALETRATLRTTLPGILIHQLTAIMWAAVHEVTFGRNATHHPVPMQLLGGAASAATACFVDYALTPKRFQPGFEKHLSSRGMFVTYAAFGVGLAFWGLIRTLQDKRH